MIIECVKCSKKFEVNSDLIPTQGRSIQCGSCNHTWFFKKNNYQEKIFEKKVTITNDNLEIKEKMDEIPFKAKENITKNEIKTARKNISKGKSIIKIDKSNKTSFLSKLLSYTVVLIISFIALIVVIDTFKFPLYKILPQLEFLLFSFFEILKDIKLFLIDLF